jgi:hypothetical protein
MTKKSVGQVSAHTIINGLPDQSRRMVLYAVVGALNSHIINNAQSLVARLSRDDVDFKEYTLEQCIHMMEEPDWRYDTLLNVRRVMSVAEGLRDQLVELTNNDEAGSITDAIDYRTRPAPVRAINFNVFKQTLIASRIIKKDAPDALVEDMIKATAERQAQENHRSAERTAGMRGGIEWVIDHVFNPDTGFEQPDNIEDLHKELRAQIYDTIRARIDSERLTAVSEIIQNRRTPRYTLADATILADSHDLAEMLDAHVEEATID